jgi:hypothetical protein
VDIENIRAIEGWPIPMNEVRYFMGLVGYYRIFIDDFSKIDTQSLIYKRRV